MLCPELWKMMQVERKQDEADVESWMGSIYPSG